MLRLRAFMFERVYLGPSARRRERPRIERMLRALFDHYAGRSSDDEQARDRLARGDDRPLRDPRVRGPVGAAGLLSVALFTKDTIDRVRDAVDMVHLVGREDRPPPGRHALDRAVPVPRRAHAVVLGERRGEALLLLRLRRGRRRVQVRPADGGARLPGGGGAAGRALGVQVEREDDDPEGGAAPPPARAAARAARPRGAASTPTYLWESAEAAPAREYLASRGLSGRGARASSGWATRRAPGTGCWWARARAASARRSWWRPGWPSAAENGGLYDRFRGPDHVPAGGRARAGARLRRAGRWRRGAARST